MHRRDRRDHAHRPVASQAARRDGAGVVRPAGPAANRRQRDRPARRLRRRQRRLLHQRRPDGARTPRARTTVLRDPTLVSEEPVSALYGKLFKLGRHGGVREIADLWRFENENNPDAEAATRRRLQPGRRLRRPTGASSSPTPAATASCGSGASAGSRRSPCSRTSRTRPRSALPDVQAVPTGVVKGPDGALYMSQLTGFPFLPAAANVFRIDPRTGARDDLRVGLHERDRPRLRA